MVVNTNKGLLQFRRENNNPRVREKIPLRAIVADNLRVLLLEGI